MMEDFFFLLKFEHLRHYVIRLWISFKTFVLSGCLWHYLRRWRGITPRYFQVLVKVSSFPAQRLLSPTGERFLIIAGQGCKFRLPTRPLLLPSHWPGGGLHCYYIPRGFHWHFSVVLHCLILSCSSWILFFHFSLILLFQFN